MKWFALGLVMLTATNALADSIVPTRTIRSQTILTAEDLELIGSDEPGTLSKLEDVIGMEARVVLYAGRAIRADDVGPPAIIERNQIVALVFRSGGLTITTEGRSLARGGVGDVIRVMNIGSRKTVMGKVLENGMIVVSAQ